MPGGVRNVRNCPGRSRSCGSCAARHCAPNANKSEIVYRGIHFPLPDRNASRLHARSLNSKPALIPKIANTRRRLSADSVQDLGRAHGFGNGCGGGFRNSRFPIATFFDAGSHRAHLAALLDDECRAAFRAGLGDRQVRRGEIAMRDICCSRRRRAGVPSWPRAPVSSPVSHFGHLMPSVFERMNLHFG